VGWFLNSSLPRVLPIGIILLALQTTLFVEMRPFGVIIQVLLAFAASAGAVGGPERGAIVGFVVGLMFDLSIGTPLGGSSLTMGTAGYIAGWCDVIRVETTWWLAAGFVALGAAVGEVGVPVVRRFIGEEDAFVPEMWTIIPVVTIAAAVLSLVLVPLARFALHVAPPEFKLPTDG
jgi:cell shape-determining protein MreD